MSMSCFFNCLAERLNGASSRETEYELNELLKKAFTIHWDFSDIEVWFNKAGISEENKKYIVDMIEQMKAKIKIKG